MSFHFLFVLHYCCCPLICVCPATDWKKMELKFGQSCSGAVFIHSKGKTSAVSRDGWTRKEGSMLCQDLQCGEFKSSSIKELTNDPFWNNSFHCERDPKTIWECENSSLPAQVQQQQLHIACQGTFFFFLISAYFLSNAKVGVLHKPLQILACAYTSAVH